MKILYLISLLSISSLYSNILLQKPKSLSHLEIEELAKNWYTGFNWNFGKGCNFTCCYENGQASFLLQVFGIPIRSYNFQYINNIKKIIKEYSNQNQRPYYFAAPLKLSNQTPTKLNFEELCKLLKNKNFIFYTGAGISASGKVATMNGLEKSLKLGEGKKVFLKEVFLNPKTITYAFYDFCKSAIYGSPTHAHYALHKIAQYKNICILTENLDLLQQRTGSAPIFMYSDAAYSITETNLKEVDILICIGLSHDDHGFIAHYKKQNPNCLILAIDLGMPNFLSDKDFIIQEDLQIILPNLANVLIP